MKNIKYLLIIIIFSSCNFFEPIDKTSMKKIELKPDKEKLIGKWELDSFSYNSIKKQEKKFDGTVFLTLSDNHIFEINDLPNYNQMGSLIEPKFTSFNGNWSLSKSFNKKYWELKLEFLTNQNRRSQVFKLYNKKNDGLIFWKSIGDPDSGNRLLFKKTKSK